MLRRRGIRHDVVDDVVQETAARVIVHRVGFTDADDLYRWASVVAYRVAIDTIRRERRQSELAPEVPASADVSREAMARYWLEVVQRGFAQLPLDEREAIVTHVKPTDRRAAVRTAVRRHRARAHLLQLAEGLGVVLAWLAAQAVRSRPRPMATAAALSPMLVLFATTLLPNIGTPSTHGPTPGLSASDVIHPNIAPRPHIAPLPAPVTRVLGHTEASASGGLPVPKVRLPIQLPAGTGVVGTRPKQPDDHFVCIESEVLGQHCLDLPIKITS